MVTEINVIGEFNAALENKFNKDIAGLGAGDILAASITSHGGEVDVLKRMAAKIYDFKEAGGKFITYVPDYAESAGFFFFLLGDERDVADKATVHYHAPRFQVEQGFTATKTNLTEMLEGLTEYQEFTNGIFKASVDIDPELFSLIENAELPMNRAHLVSLGIIN